MANYNRNTHEYRVAIPYRTYILSRPAKEATMRRIQMNGERTAVVTSFNGTFGSTVTLARMCGILILVIVILHLYFTFGFDQGKFSISQTDLHIENAITKNIHSIPLRK